MRASTLLQSLAVVGLMSPWLAWRRELAAVAWAVGDGCGGGGGYPVKFSTQRVLSGKSSCRERDIDARCLGRSDFRYVRDRR